MQYPIVRTRFTRVFFLIACMLGLSQCFSANTIESQPWAEGEKLILNFDGPATVSYKLADGNQVQIPVDKEESLKFLNVFSNMGYNTVFFVELSDQEMKLNVGLPEDLAPPSSGLTNLFNQYKNREVTQYKNLNREDAMIDSAAGVTIQGKFANAETERKVAVCKHNGAVREDAGATPNLNCPITDRVEHTGEIFKSVYSKDELLSKINDENRNLIGANPRIPFEVVVKNTRPVDAGSGNTGGNDSAQRGGGGSGGSSGANPVGASGAEGKGGCSLAMPTSFASLDVGLLAGLSAGLLGLSRRRIRR